MKAPDSVASRARAAFRRLSEHFACISNHFRTPTGGGERGMQLAPRLASRREVETMPLFWIDGILLTGILALYLG